MLVPILSVLLPAAGQQWGWHVMGHRGTPGRERALGQAAPGACFGEGAGCGHACKLSHCTEPSLPLPHSPSGVPACPSSLSGQGGHSTGLEVNEQQPLGEGRWECLCLMPKVWHLGDVLQIISIPTLSVTTHLQCGLPAQRPVVFHQGKLWQNVTSSNSKIMLRWVSPCCAKRLVQLGLIYSLNLFLFSPLGSRSQAVWDLAPPNPLTRDNPVSSPNTSFSA